MTVIGSFIMPKSNSMPTFPKNIQKLIGKYWQAPNLWYIIKYSFQRATTEYGYTQISKDGASRQRSSMLMKILLSFSMPFVSGWKRESTKHDFEFQSRLHECETKTSRGNSTLMMSRYTFVCRLFVLPKMPVTTEWPAEWDMFFRWSIAKIRACQEKRNAAWDGGRNCIQAKQQKQPRERQRRCRIP